MLTIFAYFNGTMGELNMLTPFENAAGCLSHLSHLSHLFQMFQLFQLFQLFQMFQL